MHRDECTNQEVFDLCSEALNSPVPPLEKSAIREIALIKTECLRLNEGANQFHIEEIFSELNRFPPVAGPDVAEWLELLTT